ncbi:glycosyltransferase [Halovibrio variabilis]|uniref:glycosyltransferase n=1 Tax=Halovibrio variabilis TaxID=31910 RepID=UPI0011BF91AA|nr:glycosyltransferase [Halovibrio variabilis]
MNWVDGFGYFYMIDTLAIVADSFNIPSETFIRSHVRDISPGRTVLICRDGRGSEVLGLPVLSEIRREPEPRHLVDRLARALRSRYYRYLDPCLRGNDERQVRDFFHRHEVTVVLAEYGPNGSLLRLACKHARIPLYVHFHGFDATKYARTKHWRRHYRRLFQDVAGVIVPSEFLAGRLRELGCPGEKLHVSANGISPDEFNKSVRETGRIVSVGRLVEKKAPHLTIRAFAIVRQQQPHSTLDIVGDGPLYDVCIEEIRRLGLEDSVRLRGAQSPDYVRALLSRAELLVQHSVTARDGDMESFGISLVEAMASSIPVVTTNHNGFSETVIDGETGFLVEEGDVEGMAEAMLILMNDRVRAESMGQAGRVRVETNFTQEKTASRLRVIMGLAPQS